MRKTRVKSLIPILIACLAVNTAWSSVSVDDPAPDFALRAANGMTFRLSEFRSEIVLLSFSSERCTRCSDSLPFLQDLYRRHQSDGVSVIDVDIDGNTRHSTDLAAELGLTFPILLDTGQSVSRLYDPDQLPLTLLIDREGTVRYVDKGFRGESQAQISAELNRLLAD